MASTAVIAAVVAASAASSAARNSHAEPPLKGVYDAARFGIEQGGMSDGSAVFLFCMLLVFVLVVLRMVAD